MSRLPNSYLRLEPACTIRSQIRAHVESVGPDFFDGGPRQGFPNGEVPRELLDQDLTLKTILDGTSCKRGIIFRMEPWTCYRWHQDHTRGCAVNMLIKGAESHTFFGKRITTQIYDYEELIYEPDRLYLFNTAVEHTVFNGPEERWMFSMSFPLTQTYQDLVEQCRSLGLVH